MTSVQDPVTRPARDAPRARRARLVSRRAHPRTLSLVKALGAITAVLVWWFASAASRSPYVPSLERVLDSAYGYWVTGAGQEDFLASLGNLGAGLGLAVVLGVGGGLLIGQHRLLDRAVSPGLEFVRAIPATALLPFAMVVFGIGTGMQVFLITLGCLFPILLNVVDGCRQLPNALHETTAGFGITGWYRQVFVVLPAVSARAAAGIRIAIPLGLILVVTSEMVGTTVGIGSVLNTAQNSFNFVAVWSAVLILGVLGVVLNTLFAAIERRGLRWYENERSRT